MAKAQKTPEQKAAEAEAKRAAKAAQKEAASGFTRMLAPDDVSVASFEGEEFDVDEDGEVEVPTIAVPSLISHGFKKV